jgi:glutathione S-transferase
MTDDMRLFQFSYSPFAAKVRKCLELKGLEVEVVEVAYLDRRELVALTGGHVHVPVLDDGGKVVTDSARITAYLDERYESSLRLDPLAVVVEQWAEGPLEDVAFRVATPGLEARFAQIQGGREDARALFRVMKERRYGAGCVEAWRREADELSARLVALLAPVAKKVGRQPFLLGETPTLADAAVYGQLFMVEAGAPGWIAACAPALRDWWERLRAARGRRRG